MSKLTPSLASFVYFFHLLQELVGSLSPQIVLNPDNQYLNVMEGYGLEVNCSVKDSAQAEKWQIPYWKAQGKVHGSLHQKIISYNTVTLLFHRIHRSDAGLYSCSYNTSTSVVTKSLFVIVDAKLKKGAKCGSNQFICEGSSHCIALHYRCDNQPNCEDGSDELNCKDLCKDKFRCVNGRCIDKTLECDTENNCGDWSDEYCQLRNTAESKKDTANTTINVTKTNEDHMTWLKTTLYVVIGCTVSVVFFISIIVVAVFRIRMKRNTVRRTYNSARGGSRRNERHHDPDTPNYQSDDPFLGLSPSANFGNIIVNVNNGIQYVPGSEFTEFTAIMEAPPSYSDVEREIFDTQNIQPPDYSTIDRNPLQVNNVANVTRQANQTSGSEQTAISSRQRDRSNPAIDSRPRTQNAAVQTLTHRSQRSRPQSQTDSLPRQPNLNVQGGQIVLTNLVQNSNSQATQVSDSETATSQSSERPSSAVLLVQNGQIMLSNPNLNTAISEETTNIQVDGESNVVSDENLETNTRSNLQVSGGQIVLASESTTAVISESSEVNDSPSRRQLDVCDGQIVLK